MKFQVDNMTCSGCARSVSLAIQDIDAAAKVDIDVPSRAVQVTSTATPAQIIATLADVGFEARAV